jgi:hypothetical protein
LNPAGPLLQDPPARDERRADRGIALDLETGEGE